MAEKKKEYAKKDGFFEKLPQMDKEKATRYVVKGLVAAVIFATIMMVSGAIALNATAWSNLFNQYNSEGFLAGLYGYHEYLEIGRQITLIRLGMQSQQIYVVNIARIGANIALVFIAIGFIGFAINEKLDSRTRWTCLIIAGIILIVMLFGTFFTQFNINFS